MDKDLYDEIIKMESTGKEVKSMLVYPEGPIDGVEPHLPEKADKKLQLILVSSISDKEMKSLSSFMGESFPASEAWKYFMRQTHTSKYHAERLTKEKFSQPSRTRNTAEFIKFCEEIEGQIIALKQVGIEDPMKDFNELFNRAAIQALPRGGEGDWMAQQIRLEGKDWGWKDMKKKMRESMEISEEIGSTSLFVPRGNTTKLEYQKFKPMVNTITDADNGEGQEEGEVPLCLPCGEQGYHNDFSLEIANMSDEQFGQFCGQVFAVRKGAGKGNGKGSGRTKGGDTGKGGDKCSACGRSGHTLENCTFPPKTLINNVRNYFFDKKCHACNAIGHGWRTCMNLYAKLRHGTKLESNPPAGISEESKKDLSKMLDGLENFILKNQDKSKEKLLPPNTPVNSEAPIQKKRKTKLQTGAASNATGAASNAMVNALKQVIPAADFTGDYQSWENNGMQSGSSSNRIRSRCGMISSKSAQIPISGFAANENSSDYNYFDADSYLLNSHHDIIRPIKSTGPLQLSSGDQLPNENLNKLKDQISNSGSDLDALREIKDRKKRDFDVKKHEVGDKIEGGMMLDTGADAHMTPFKMFDLPINTEKAHLFETADGTVMPSPGTQYIPGYMGPNFDIPFTVECFVADVDRIILSPGLLRKKGVSFTMEPDKSFIKLKNGAIVSLVNDEKETVFLEAKFSNTHPEFQATQTKGNVPCKGIKSPPRKKHKRNNNSFRRQGTKK